MDGVIVVDKPEGMTSHDVVNRVRRLANTRRIGHLGTLDPMATGVLPLLVGRATRLAQFFSAGEKIYHARIQFGWSTDTYDREGRPTSEAVAPRFFRDDLEAALAQFRGRILQTPPAFSAKKIAGTPAHRLARQGAEVSLQPVTVEVFALDLLDFEDATARIVLRCSPGTYVRSIAHDLGRQLGCGAFLSGLRRTASGEFTSDSAFTLGALDDLARAGELETALIPAIQLLPEFPNARVDAIVAGQIRQGKDFRTSPFSGHSGSKFVKAISAQGDLVAIGEARLPHLYHPIVVL